MLYIKRLILVFIVGFIFTSCDEEFFDKPIDLDIDDHVSKMAATAVLGDTDENNLVLVSYTSSPFDNNTNDQLLDNATITLSGNNNTISFDFLPQERFYVSNSSINFIPNTEYTLTIDSPNYNTITSKQIYPEPVAILEATLTENTLKIKFNDNPNKKNYYILQLQKYDNDDNQFYNKVIDPFGSSTRSSGFCDTCINFNDDTFNGEQSFEIVATNYFYNPDTTYKAILYNITEDFYKYDRSLFRSIYAQDNPFVEPVILHRNFENGYGIFGLINKSELIFNQ